jgi:hypothetical protein
VSDLRPVSCPHSPRIRGRVTLRQTRRLPRPSAPPRWNALIYECAPGWRWIGSNASQRLSGQGSAAVMMRELGLDLDSAVAACADGFLRAGGVLDPAGDGQGG